MDAVVQPCCVLKGARPNHGHASMVAWNLVKFMTLVRFGELISPGMAPRPHERCVPL